jgi:hypothetical protein
LKGLYTPCAGNEPAVRHRARNTADADQTQKAGADQADSTSPHSDKPHHARTAKPERPDRFAVGKLCRDSRGLFTPCPR